MVQKCVDYFYVADGEKAEDVLINLIKIFKAELSDKKHHYKNRQKVLVSIENVDDYYKFLIKNGIASRSKKMVDLIHESGQLKIMNLINDINQENAINSNKQQEVK